MFDNIDEALTRLRGSILLYNKEPVYINNVKTITGPIYLQVEKLPLSREPYKRNYLNVLITDPELEVKNYQLGMADILGSTYYFQRLPIRKYKLGLYEANCIGYSITNEAKVHITNAMYEPELLDMFSNKHPNYAESIEILASKKRETIAFSKVFALQFDKLGVFNLYYKQEKVAISENGTKYVTSDTYKYLDTIFRKNNISVSYR